MLSSTCDKYVIDEETLRKYIPREEMNLLPVTVQPQDKIEASEKEMIVRMLLQLKQEVDYLKDVVNTLSKDAQLPRELPHFDEPNEAPEEQNFDFDQNVSTETVSLKSLGDDLIDKVLRKHGGNRKSAAAELGISERTLYRRLKK